MAWFAHRLRMAVAQQDVVGSILRNPGFESNLQHWTQWFPGGQGSVAAVDTSNPHGGTRKAYFWNTEAYQQSLHQTVTVEQGSHLVSAWVKLQNFTGEATPGIVRMELQLGATTQYVDIPVTGDVWTLVSGQIDGSGQLDIGFMPM